MIVWRGFGFLAFLLGALGALAGIGLSTALSPDGEVGGPLIGIGILLGGVASFALGWWLNVLNPQKKAQTWVEQRRAELNHAVATGQFQATPGVVPSSQAEAQAQADALLAHETPVVTKRLSNIHTLFWIPMQWAGVVIAILGVFLAIVLSTS